MIKRPTNYCEEVILDSIPNIVILLKEYLESVGNGKEELLGLEKEAKVLARESAWRDGYKLAKILEDEFNWDSDSELVESLTEVEHIVYDSHRKLEKEWVKNNNITPKLKIGDKVMYKDYSESKETEFEITKIYYDEAKYGIQNESYKIKKRTYMIPYENFDK